MLTAQQLRAVIHQTIAYKRARYLLKGDWASVNADNPLAREIIGIADLEFVIALQEAGSSHTAFDIHDYRSVMQFIRQNEDQLGNGSREWLLREFQ